VKEDQKPPAVVQTNGTGPPLGKRKRNESNSRSESVTSDTSSDEDTKSRPISNGKSPQVGSKRIKQMRQTSPDSQSSESSSEEEEEEEDEDDSEEESDKEDSFLSSSPSDSESDSEESESSSSDSMVSSSDQSIASPKPTKPIIRTPPGKGSERTHIRNRRKASVKKLKRLVADGVLPAGSRLSDLVKFEQRRLNEDLEEREDDNTTEGLAKNKLAGQATGQEHQKSVTPTVTYEVPPASTYQSLVPRALSRQQPKSATKATEPKEAPLPQQKLFPDPLLAKFYEQVDLATQNRKQKQPAFTSVSNDKGTTTPSSKVVIRAFECEPEWCGLVQAEEGEEVQAVEIDPPSLPFVDNYRSRGKNQKNNTPATNATASPVNNILTEKDILKLPKLETPLESLFVYFKTMFLHPKLLEPVVDWRCGKISWFDGTKITIDIQNTFDKDTKEDEDGDEEMEEGEVASGEETFELSQLIDIRYIGVWGV
jgi:hypothetical protein